MTLETIGEFEIDVANRLARHVESGGEVVFYTGGEATLHWHTPADIHPGRDGGLLRNEIIWQATKAFNKRACQLRPKKS